MRCALRPLDDSSIMETSPSGKFSPSLNDFRLPPPQVSCSSSDDEYDDDDDDDGDSNSRITTFTTTMHSASSLATMSASTSNSDCRMSDAGRSTSNSVEAPYRRTRSGRECPSPPHSSAASSTSSTRPSEMLSALAIHAGYTPERRDDSEQSIEETSAIDQDFALFEQTTQMLSSPYHQLASLIYLGAMANNASRTDLGETLERDGGCENVFGMHESPTGGTGLSDYVPSEKEDELMKGLSRSTSALSNVSHIMCLLCYAPQGDCEEWCAGKDLQDILNSGGGGSSSSSSNSYDGEHATSSSPMTTHRHPCDEAHFDCDLVSNGTPSIRHVTVAQEDGEYDAGEEDATSAYDDEEGMSMDTDQSASFTSASSSSTDGLPIGMKRANTPSSPTPQPSPACKASLWDKRAVPSAPTPNANAALGDESWQALIPRCKNGSSGAKHWCEQLQRHWYDTCEDAHCEPCMEAFFTSSMRGKRNVARSAESSNETETDVPVRSRKRNSFAMLLVAVQKAAEEEEQASAPQSMVLKAKSNNKSVSIANCEDAKNGVKSVLTKRTRPGMPTTPAASSAVERAPTANSRKSMILLRKRTGTPSRRSTIPLVPTLAHVSGTGRAGAGRKSRPVSPGKRATTPQQSAAVRRRVSQSKIATAVKSQPARRSPGKKATHITRNGECPSTRAGMR